MLYKDAKQTRQSPLQKAMAFGEDVAKFAGVAKTLWDTGKMVYQGVQSAAPIVAALM